MTHEFLHTKEKRKPGPWWGSLSSAEDSSHASSLAEVSWSNFPRYLRLQASPLQIRLLADILGYPTAHVHLSASKNAYMGYLDGILSIKVPVAYEYMRIMSQASGVYRPSVLGNTVNQQIKSTARSFTAVQYLNGPQKFPGAGSVEEAAVSVTINRLIVCAVAIIGVGVIRGIAGGVQPTPAEFISLVYACPALYALADHKAKKEGEKRIAEDQGTENQLTQFARYRKKATPIGNLITKFVPAIYLQTVIGPKLDLALNLKTMVRGV